MAAFTRETALAQMRSRSRPSYTAGRLDTICAVHRDLWLYINALPEPQRTEAEELLLTAYLMGSKMNAKLVEYKSKEQK